MGARRPCFGRSLLSELPIARWTSGQCLALQVFPAEPAQQLAIPLESHPVEVPRNRGLGSEGSKAADYLMLEYFEGPQLLGLDIAPDLWLTRGHSSAPPPRIIDRQPVVCHIDCCRDIGTYVWMELAPKYSAGVGVMMPLTSRFVDQQRANAAYALRIRLAPLRSRPASDRS